MSKFKQVPPGVKLAPTNKKQTLKRFLSYLGKSKAMLFATIAFIIVSSLANVVGISMLPNIIDTYLAPAFATGVALGADFYLNVLLMLGVYLVGVISTYTYQRMMVSVSTGTLKRFRDDMFVKLQSLPIKYFDTHTHGELMSRFTNDTDSMREMISTSIPQLISSSITVIGTFVLMCTMSWQLTGIIVVMLAIMLLIVKSFAGKSGRYFMNQQRSLGKVNGYIEEYIEGQKVVKVFCHEEETKEGFEKLNDQLRENARKANSTANSMMPIMGNISYISYAILAMVGVLLHLVYGDSVLSIGVLVTFLPLARQLSAPIGQTSQQLNVIMMGIAGAERIFEVLDEEPEVDDGYVTLVNAIIDEDGNVTESPTRTGRWAWKHPHHDGTLTYTELKGDVRFVDVTFGYSEDKTVLKDVSLYAKPGQKIAFVGSTGAGKTTITNLINRFYDVPDGKIRYDGININKIKKADLRRSLAMVLQDTHLFTGTVMDNIRYGKLDATDEECIEAAKLANAHFFISHLPNGYDTMLTADGANLSQGQRQLLSIARAAVANPPVLILDEATSSIDTRTEALIEKGMDKLMENKTVFVIAHRLSTVRNSNAIMVLEHGEIIERGDHETLLQIGPDGKYYQLYNGLFELS